MAGTPVAPGYRDLPGCKSAPEQAGNDVAGWRPPGQRDDQRDRSVDQHRQPQLTPVTALTGSERLPAIGIAASAEV
jgi:hypothetical protein